MLYRRFAKVVVISLSIFLLLLFIGSLFFGPGVTDGSFPIINGYELLDTGGDGTSIAYNGSENKNADIVHERVDAYKIVGDNLIVARRPRECHRAKDNALDCKVSPTCEYWTIDTIKHTVQRIDDSGGLHCK